MEPFLKVNELVSSHPNVVEISIIFNKLRIKNTKVGKCVKPITIQYLYEGDTKEMDEQINSMINIPKSLEDIIDISGTKYCAMVVNCRNKKEFNGVVYYDKGLAVIRNPVIEKEIEDREKSQFQVSEFSL
jgi:hypothetical protein